MPAVIPSTLAEAEVFERMMQMRIQRLPTSDIPRLRAACADAVASYEDHLHWTGEALMVHCLGVLETFMRFEPDDEGVIACLLHHVLDAKKWMPDDLENKYGKNVRHIVSGVHLLSHVTMKNRRMSLENLRLMFLRVSDDIRVVLLILCDHTHKLEQLNILPVEARVNICRDVLHLFAPVAARLGIYSLKHQMEGLAFPIVYPVDAARISEQLEQLHTQHGYFLNDAAHALEQALIEAGIPARVEGREKQTFSIFQKMNMKNLTHVQDVYDLFALRVVVPDDTSCYQVLGVLHRIGHPVVHRFKDYIAFPKPNGYQSLHTTLARLPQVPEGVFVEVQIRTARMHRDADLGLAAHWSYKEGGTAERANRRAKLQQALALGSPLNEVKTAGDDHIFALTPKGDIIELPEGATPLDFAFNVHSMLGLCFKAARVNGSIVPMSYSLENGDIVEVLKHKEPHPSSNWMMMLKTASAKARLKRHLLAQDRPLYMHIGREEFNAELARHHLPALDPDLTVLRMFDCVQLPFAEREDLLVKVGQGAQNASSLLSHLDALASEIRLLSRREHRKTVFPPHTQVHARVEGDIPMPVRYALCCKPDEGVHGSITGVIGRNGTIRVHRETCKMIRHANPERMVGVKWEQRSAK